ncbi:MAG TPA: aspartyl protease family protein [Sphingomicrobium sp.]
MPAEFDPDRASEPRPHDDDEKADNGNPETRGRSLNIFSVLHCILVVLRYLLSIAQIFGGRKMIARLLVLGIVLPITFLPVASAQQTSAGHPAHGSGGAHNPASTSSTSTSFDLFRGNRVYVTAEVNGRSVQALLDTGASTTTLDRAYARSIGIPPGRKIEGRGAGGRVEAELVEGVSLKIGGMRFDNLAVGVMDLSSVERQLGRPMPIIVGRELFNNAAITFDWDSRQMTIVPAAGFTEPSGAIVLPVERRGPFNFVKLGIAGLPPIDALLDLGNGGSVILPSDYWLKQPRLASLRFAESQSGGVGGLHASRAVTLPSVEFAGRKFDAVPAVLAGDSQGGDPAHGANLGIGMLKQFDVTLDLGRNRIFLRARPKAVPFDRDRAGVRVEADKVALKVSFVSPQAPAAKAGLKQGDRIVAINGQPIGADFYATPTGAWNKAPAGTDVILLLSDGSQLRFALSDFY